jgi:hypothetical protein
MESVTFFMFSVANESRQENLLAWIEPTDASTIEPQASFDFGLGFRSVGSQPRILEVTGKDKEESRLTLLFVLQSGGFRLNGGAAFDPGAAPSSVPNQRGTH